MTIEALELRGIPFRRKKNLSAVVAIIVIDWSRYHLCTYISSKTGSTLQMLTGHGLIIIRPAAISNGDWQAS